jgi:hypothetical protein
MEAGIAVTFEEAAILVDFTMTTADEEKVIDLAVIETEAG